MTNDVDVGLGCSHLKGTDLTSRIFPTRGRFFRFQGVYVKYIYDMHVCHTHTIHGTGIFTYIWLNFMVNVGKYMDGMGYIIY